jgi:dihydroorotase
MKREEYRRALRQAAVSGELDSFLGTDSASYLRHLKEAACGCDGIFGAPAALAAYLKVFEEEGALANFERFASINGPMFYGLPHNEERISLEKKPHLVCEAIDVTKLGNVHPLFGRERLDWSVCEATGGLNHRDRTDGAGGATKKG